MSLWETFFMGFVSFFTTGMSCVSPSFILVVPVDAMCYYLYGGTARMGHRMSGIAEPATGAPVRPPMHVPLTACGQVPSRLMVLLQSSRRPIPLTLQDLFEEC